MVPIFDLDDTLYPERSFVESGFRAVADWLEDRMGWNAEESLQHMLDVLEKNGRGAVFDSLLLSKQAMSVRLRNECVRVYRHHPPNISLAPNVAQLLSGFTEHLYLVTDGHKIVQLNKVRSLKIEGQFRKIFITHRYGIRHAKPSIYCFEIIRRMERCDWSDLAYVGDNPEKDFVNLTPLGVYTIRVLTGAHRNVRANPGFEASHVIASLDELPELLKREQK